MGSAAFPYGSFPTLAAPVVRIADSGPVKISEHQGGDLVRMQTTDRYAMEMAVSILVFLDSELNASIEDTGWRHGYALEVATPVLIQLESLEVELSTDGNEVLLSRLGGSRYEFEELCGLIGSQWDHM